VTTWVEAQRLAAVAATRVLTRHQVSFGDRIPLLDIIEREGVIVRFGPLPRLAGAYVADAGSDPGILVNNRLPLANQRYTSGHELGHHVFDHGTTSDIETDWLSPTATDSGPVPIEERLAEAFAAWLMMPRRLVEWAMQSLDLTAISTPTDAYRLSLLLGASYRATCVHLTNLGLLDWAAMDRMVAVQPKTIKTDLLGTGARPVGQANVHLVSPSTDTPTIRVGSGDVVIIASSAGPVATIDVEDELVSVDTARSGADDELRLRVKRLSVANPARPTTRATVTVAVCGTEYELNIVGDHPLSGMSEVWFQT